MQAHDAPFAKQPMAIGSDSLLPQAAVAPHAGAWIETAAAFTILASRPSHLTQVRGLKQNEHSLKLWLDRSHLTQVRGLKLSPVRACMGF